LNIGSSTFSGPDIALGDDQKKIITIFSADTFQRLIDIETLIGTTTDPHDSTVSYPCASNLIDYECRFVQGERLTTQYVNNVAGIA